MRVAGTTNVFAKGHGSVGKLISYNERTGDFVTTGGAEGKAQRGSMGMINRWMRKCEAADAGLDEEVEAAPAPAPKKATTTDLMAKWMGAHDKRAAPERIMIDKHAAFKKTIADQHRRIEERKRIKEEFKQKREREAREEAMQQKGRGASAAVEQQPRAVLSAATGGLGAALSSLRSHESPSHSADPTNLTGMAAVLARLANEQQAMANTVNRAGKVISKSPKNRSLASAGRMSLR